MTGWPGISEDQAGLPGILFAVLFHEWHHAAELEGMTPNAGGGGPPPYDTPCGDIRLQLGVAQSLCELIAAGMGAGLDMSNLCDLYNLMKKSFNVGLHKPGGAFKAYTDMNCPGTVPMMPACPGC